MPVSVAVGDTVGVFEAVVVGVLVAVVVAVSVAVPVTLVVPDTVPVPDAVTDAVSETVSVADAVCAEVPWMRVRMNRAINSRITPGFLVRARPLLFERGDMRPDTPATARCRCSGAGR